MPNANRKRTNDAHVPLAFSKDCFRSRVVSSYPLGDYSVCK
jgi:hypothetical protein